MKHKRLLGYGAIGLTLTAIGVAFLRPFNLGNLLFRARAAEAISYSQTVSRATGTLVTRSNDYYYVSTKTSSGTTMYLRSVNDSSYQYGNNYVAVLPGTTDRPSYTAEITFTTGNATATSESLFEFQNITSISMTSDTTSRTMDVYKSDDGVNWTSAGTIASAGGTNTEVEGAKYVKVINSASYVAYINTFTINYSCSYIPPTPKVLDSISVSGATTEFTVGDTFEFDGTVTASYTDSTLYPDADVTSSAVVVTEPDMSEAAEDVEIVISYTEKGVTKTDSYTIDIIPAPELVSIAATDYTDTYYVDDTFDFDGTVTAYYSDGSEEEIDDYTIDTSDLDMSTAGTYDVVISFEGEDVTIEITVEEHAAAVLDGTYSLTLESVYQEHYTLYKTLTFTFTSTTATAGTGYYNYYRYNTNPSNKIVYNSTVNFTYVISNGNEITIRFASYGTLYETKADGTQKTEMYTRNYFDGNLPFIGSTSDWTTDNTNSTLRWNSSITPNTITVGIYAASGSGTTQRVLSKQ